MTFLPNTIRQANGRQVQSSERMKHMSSKQSGQGMLRVNQGGR